MKSNKKTRTDKSEVALQPTDPIHPVKLGAHSIYLSTGVGCQLCRGRFRRNFRIIIKSPTEYRLLMNIS